MDPAERAEAISGKAGVPDVYEWTVRECDAEAEFEFNSTLSSDPSIGPEPEETWRPISTEPVFFYDGRLAHPEGGKSTPPDAAAEY